MGVRKFIFVAASLAATVPVIPCCVVGPDGKPIQFAGQQNIVIWNEAERIEHFIRKPEFQTNGKDFGFIAPTPSIPQIAAVDEQAFQTVDSVAPIYAFGPLGASGGGSPREVQIVQSVNVGQYRAIAVAPTDPDLLNDWLKKNEYVMNPEVARWVNYYLEKGWYLTAFKYQNPEAERTAAIRMTFRTQHAFNPYYVPKGTGKTPGSSLHLFFVSAGEQRPVIGNATPWVKPLWKAKLPEAKFVELAKELGLKPEEMPKDAKVSFFYDSTFPNGATEDLFFRQY